MEYTVMERPAFQKTSNHDIELNEPTVSSFASLAILRLRGVGLRMIV